MIRSTSSAAATDVCREALQRIRHNDLDGWMALCDEQVVLEFPFATDDMPRRVAGKDAVAEYMHAGPGSVEYHDLPEATLYETDAAGTVVVEMRSTGRVRATGAPFDMSYIAVVTVHDGHIVHYRDYWNPLQVRQLIGGAQV